MKILIFNLGSTSFKYVLFADDKLRKRQEGNFEINQKQNIQDQVDAITRKILREIGNPDEIDFVGHRVVHSGGLFDKDLLITEKDISKLEKINHWAPLHNVFNLAGIKAGFKYLPEAKTYLAFDTSFYNNLPEKSKVYPIPFKYYEKKGLKKFGFHGISHEYAFGEACLKLKLKPEKTSGITFHLGGGSSATAIQNGVAIDTTMGMTPLGGLMMQTRSGDIDPGLFKLIAENNNFDISEVENILNKKSGIFGITGYDNYLDLLDGKKKKNKQAVLAFEMYIDRLVKQVGAYVFLLGKVDFITFSGCVGAGDPVTRNEVSKKIKKILPKIKILKIEPNEELAIAKKIIM
jgi:acetate kinase